MSDQKTIDVLNRLLALEQGNLIPRLAQADPFVAWPAAEDRPIVHRMIADALSHQRDLANVILRLRGTPAPPRYAIDSGGLHFLSLDYLIPGIIAGVRELVRAYEAAGATPNPEANALIQRILANHRRHSSELDRLHAVLTAPTA